MTGLDLVNFCDSLATWMASRCSPTLTYPGQLWRNQAPEIDATDQYSVLRPYGGDLPWVPVPSVALQVMTISPSNDGALNQTQSLFNALLDAVGRPLRMTVIPAVHGGPRYRLNAVDPKVPGLIGRDNCDRAQVVFNFDCKVVALLD